MDRSRSGPGARRAGVARWWAALAAVAILGLELTAAHHPRAQLSAAPSSGLPVASSGLGSRTGLAKLPAAAQAASRALGARERSFYAHAAPGGLEVVNRPQRLHARFGRSGITLRSGALVWSLGPPTLGGSATADRVAPTASANLITYRYRDVSEWYANGPLGLEQGFTLSRKPSAVRGGRVTLTMKTSGNARGRVVAGAHGTALRFAHGPSLIYGGLRASDARGRDLPASLALRAGSVIVNVDARGARYPLRIDPLIRQGEKLIGGEEEATPEGEFGYSVALSGDGNTALVGVPNDHPRAGAVWVFARVGGAWVQQGAPLNSGEEETPAEKQQCEPATGDENSICGFGASVALSTDGNTALIGSPLATEPCPTEPKPCPEQGAAWVYTRSGSTWTRHGPLTGGSNEGVAGHFGRTVALSADGGTAVVSAPADRTNRGSVWVFTRSGSEWVQQGPKLTGAKESGEGYFGAGLALSADGGTALIGGPGDNGFRGAVWTFARSGVAWVQQGPKLTVAEEEIGAGHFGRGVALSSSGSVALIGAFGYNARLGAAWVYRRSGAAWVQQGPKLTGGEEVGEGHFGRSVALSSDGTTALIGGPGDNGKKGAAWTFTASGGAWSQSQRKLAVPDAAGRAWFGYAVALSGAADEAMIGAPKDTMQRGAAWAFAQGVEPEAPPEEEPPHKKHKEPPGKPPGEPVPGGGLTAGQPTAGAASGVQPFGPVAVRAGCRLSQLPRNLAVNSKGRTSLKLLLLGSGTCREKVTLTIKQRRSHGRVKYRTIASATFSIAAGRTVVLALKLNTLGRTLLHAGHGRLGASLAIVRLSPAPVQARSASVRLVLQRAHGKSSPKH